MKRFLPILLALLLLAGCGAGEQVPASRPESSPSSVSEPSSAEPFDEEGWLAGADLDGHARVLTEHIAFTIFEYPEVRDGSCPPEEGDMTLFAIEAS